jgi:GxxExxY protein
MEAEMQRKFASGTRPKFEGKHADLSERILNIFFTVHRELGYGFSEKVYERSLAIALREAGFKVEEQIPLKVFYHGQMVGEYITDMMINNLILLELKAATQIAAEHEAQLLSYLKASDIEVGYVLNFGQSATFKRRVFDNERKGAMNWTENRA